MPPYTTFMWAPHTLFIAHLNNLAIATFTTFMWAPESSGGSPKTTTGELPTVIDNVKKLVITMLKKLQCLLSDDHERHPLWKNVLWCVF